jgi:hypothetical protein
MTGHVLMIEELVGQVGHDGGHLALLRDQPAGRRGPSIGDGPCGSVVRSVKAPWAIPSQEQGAAPDSTGGSRPSPFSGPDGHSSQAREVRAARFKAAKMIGVSLRCFAGGYGPVVMLLPGFPDRSQTFSWDNPQARSDRLREFLG